MIITRDKKYGFAVWDLNKTAKPWAFHSDESDNDDTFVCWKCSYNEYYSYCRAISDEQAAIFGADHLSNGQQIWVDIDKEDLIKAGINPDFMSQNYHDWPERENQ